MNALVAWLSGLLVFAAAGDARPESGPADDLAADARAAYRKALEGDLAAAERLYASVIERGGGSGDLYANLGTVQLEQEAWVDAVIQFEKALRLAPGHDLARVNLEVARRELEARPEETAPSLRDFLPTLGAIGWLGWAFLAVLGNALLAAAVVVPRARAALAAAGGLGFGAACLALAVLAWGVHRPAAVVLEAASLRGGPAPRYPELGDVPAGATVEVGERREAWVRVRSPDGRAGWVRIERLRTLRSDARNPTSVVEARSHAP